MSACGRSHGRDEAPAYDFEGRPALRFDVAAIEIQQSEAAAPAPARAARRWAEVRLVAAGERGRLRFVVREAAIDERPHEPAGLLAEPALRSEARLAVEVLVLADKDLVQARVQVEGAQAATLPLDMIEEERERLRDELLRDLMADVDRRLEAALRRRLGEYLLSP